MVKFKLLVSETHTILRIGLCVLLNKEPDLEVVGEVDGGADVITAVARLKPDLVMMDFAMSGDGTAYFLEIKEQHPETRILVLTQRAGEESIRSALRAGVNGYILKTASDGELIGATRSVLAGNIYLSPAISDQVIHAFMLGDGHYGHGSIVDMLTSRELEILQRVAEGHTNRHIAEQLNLSVKTVEKHRSNLMRKLDLHNASALTTFAIGHGLLGGGE